MGKRRFPNNETGAFPGLTAVQPPLLRGCGEGEQLEQVADSRAVGGHVYVATGSDRVGEVVAAAVGYRRQVPVPLDELEHGNVIRVVVGDDATLGVGRDDDHRDAGAISEEVDGLNVTGVIVTAAFVEGDEDGSVRGQ